MRFEIPAKLRWLGDRKDELARAFVTLHERESKPHRRIQQLLNYTHCNYLLTTAIMADTEMDVDVPQSPVDNKNSQSNTSDTRTAENVYRLVPVELGTPSDGMRPVLKGIAEGTPFVSGGAFHLNNERKRSELE